MSVLFYRRPDYLAKSMGPLNKTECQIYVERAKKSERAIPKGLSFDDIVENKALPPCSLPDFMDYLVYVELNAENLQFYLWYKDYVERWENEVPDGDKALSPAWDFEARDVPEASNGADGEPDRSPSPGGRSRTRGTVRAKTRSTTRSSHSKEPSSIIDVSNMPFFNEDGKIAIPENAAVPTGASVMPFGSRAANQLSPSGQAWKAFSIQPGREEVNQIILHYLSFDSPRELNLSHKDRVATLHALQHTTHPSAFLPAFNVAEIALRGQSHPNFIRWSICNGNKPRVFFVRTMGIQHTIFGFIIAIILTLSHVSRWWRIFAATQWFIGITTLIAAYKGLCVILHASHMRTLRPWEDDASIHSATTDLEMGNKRASKTPMTLQLSEKLNNGTIKNLSTFGAAKRTSGEIEEWERSYSEKPLIKKIFDKSTWTQDETLRLLQDQIVLGAQVWGAILTVILTVIFVALPAGNFF